MTKQNNKKFLPTPTKGKGSGKGGNGPTKGGKAEPVDIKDLPLDLKEVSATDPNALPRYSSVLKKSDSDVLGIEELDGLQMELEALLSSVVVRKRYSKEEGDILQNVEKFKGKSKKGPGSPSNKRKDGKDVTGGSKKVKMNSGKPFDANGLKLIKPSKEDYDPLENMQIKPLTESQKPTTPKNETPNRFWAFVEPYCAPIQQDDLKFLEDLVKGYDDMSEFHRVPPLGQHYSIRWAKEDLELEKSKGGNEENKDVKDEAAKLLKKEKNDSPPFGELTQRLVQGLMEENLMTQVDDVMVERNNEDNIGSRNSFIASLKVANGDSLEKRLKKELEEQGILDPNDFDDDVGADEVQNELLRCQTELKAVSQQNLLSLRRLVKSAKEEMSRQEVRNKLAEADKEVCESYKRIALARSKKKSPTKKEKDQAWKALKDREAILQQLESI